MGYSGRLVFARPGVGVDVDAVLTRFGLSAPTARDSDWIEAEDPSLDPIDIDGLIHDLAGPVLIADVTTSDFATIGFGAPGLTPAAVILTPRAFRAEGLRLPSKAATEAAHEACASWSDVAPRQVAPTAIRSLVERGATLAEDIVWELVSMLGIAPDPNFERTVGADPEVIRRLKLGELGGYLRPTSDMTMVRSDEYPGRDWASERFVMGLGDGFVGVWDRKHPEEPAFRFEQNSRGFDRALHAWSGMTERLELGEQSDWFAGLIGLECNSFAPGGRFLRVADSRYLPGWGKGFAAVWDREAGRAPIIRFKGGQSAVHRAVAWAHRTAAVELAAAKLVGADRWVCGDADRWMEPEDYPRSVWILAYEVGDSRWPPYGLEEQVADGYLLHQAFNRPEPFGLWAMPEPAKTDPNAAKAAAVRWNVRGDWVRVPDDVPLTLLETARWAVEASPFAAELREPREQPS